MLTICTCQPLLIGTMDEEASVYNGTIAAPMTACLPGLPKNVLSVEVLAELAISVVYECPAKEAAQYR